MDLLESKIKLLIIKISMVFALIVFAVTIQLSSLSFAMGYKNKPEGKGLYYYSVRELSHFLKEIGYSDYSDSAKWQGDIAKNSNGTALMFFKWSKKRGDQAVIISCDGSIKEMDLPSRDVWLNDKFELVVWYEKGGIHIISGMSEENAFKAITKTEPSGGYFMKTTRSDMSEGTAIHSIERPNISLATINRFLGERIFTKDDKVFVFGNYYDTRNLQRELYIFQRKDHEIVQIEKLIIRRPRKSPAPFNVEDFSSWTDEVLFADVHDFGRAEWYVFNLKTHEMKKIGKEPFGGGWGFYLQCDIIKNVLEKRKK